MFKRLRELDPEVHLIFLGAIVFLLVGYVSLHKKFTDVSAEIKSLKQSKNENVEIKTEDSRISLDDVKNLIKDALGKSTKSTASPIAVATTQNGKRVVYISLGEGFETSSTEWIDVKNAETNLDIENDYGKDAKVYFEASLSSQDGNGQAYARLFDATHSIAVNTSDISTTGNVEFIYTSSPNLYLWRGRNLYRIQVKSPSGSTIGLSNAKVKIVY